MRMKICSRGKGVEAVLITAPDHLHVSIGCAALGAGKHVYLEKPTLHRWHEKAELERAAQQHKGGVAMRHAAAQRNAL